MALPVQPGDLLAGRYEVERVLGGGGMGVVVAAHDRALGRPVALKFLRPEGAADAEISARFLREARASSRLSGEHVARVHDTGTLATGAPYIVMERLEGEDLGARLARAPVVAVADAVGIILQACEGLAEAHAAGIVHRDLKPANLFVTRRDGAEHVKVLDFGIAKVSGPDDGELTSAQSLMGTPLYMSPEQLHSAREVDARSDVWSLGVLLYQLLTGQLPFQRSTLPEICASILLDDPEPPSAWRPGLPPDLDRAIERAMAKEADQRFASLVEFTAALAPFCPGGAAAAQRVLAALGPSMPPPPRPLSSRPPLSAAARLVRGSLTGRVDRPLDHDQLVQQIYDSAETPEGFSRCIASLGHHVGAENAQVLLIEAEGAVVENHFFSRHDIDAERLATNYHLHWKDQDPRFQIALRRADQVMSDVDVIDPEAFERSALYQEHLVATRARYSLFGIVRADEGSLVGASFMRDRPAGAFGPADVARLAALVPHLTRATRLRCLSSALREAREDLRHVLDASPAPLALLDDRGRVVVASARAERLLGARDGLQTERGVLTCVRPVEARALAAALARTAALADAGARPPATALPAAVVVTRAAGSPLTVLLSPLRPHSELRARSPSAARVLAIVHDPDHRLTLRHELLVRLHGLTATEARLAAALAAGQTLADFAAERGTTEATARTHLKRVLDKTGTKRQADLVRVLLTSIVAHQVG
ncbi:MAG: serine/threonine protein kinase [Myxococcales bacterium]|nr:MAG: serine/threonine protein kinase [Myxococcales bacterium]